MIRSYSWLSIPTTKGRAFAAHVILSLLVFSTLVVAMLLYWFPGKLFFIDGGWQGLKLVAMVDLVLGPALTLLLFKPGKPGLVLDMSIIAVLQISALSYGFYTTHQQRTVAIVYAEGAFNTLSAKDNREAVDQLRSLSIDAPAIPPVTLLSIPLLLTPDPAPGEYGHFLVDILNGYPAPHARSDQYVSISSHHKIMQKDALTEQQLTDEGAMNAVQHSLNARSVALSNVEFYRFKARFADGIAIFDPDEKRILDYVTYDKIDSKKSSDVENVASSNLER